MDSAFIYRAANELVQNARTRNIKQIARSCSLDISETSRIKDMLGLLFICIFHGIFFTLSYKFGAKSKFPFFAGPVQTGRCQVLDNIFHK